MSKLFLFKYQLFIPNEFYQVYLLHNFNFIELGLNTLINISMWNFVVFMFTIVQFTSYFVW